MQAERDDEDGGAGAGGAGVGGAVDTAGTSTTSIAGHKRKQAPAAAAGTIGGVASTKGWKSTGLRLHPVDWLESRATGPITSAAVGNVGDVFTDEFELMVAAGRDKCGALYKVGVGWLIVALRECAESECCAIVRCFFSLSVWRRCTTTQYSGWLLPAGC